MTDCIKATTTMKPPPLTEDTLRLFLPNPVPGIVHCGISEVNNLSCRRIQVIMVTIIRLQSFQLCVYQLRATLCMYVLGTDYWVIIFFQEL